MRFAASLRWVEHYQTLLAAAGAGAAVLAVFLQQRWSKEMQAKERHNERLMLIQWTFLEFKSLGEAIKSARAEQAQRFIDSIRRLLPKLAELHFGLADSIRMDIEAIEENLAYGLDDRAMADSNQQAATMTGDDWAELYAYKWTGYLEYGERLLSENGQFRFERQSRERAEFWMHRTEDHILRILGADLFYEAK